MKYHLYLLFPIVFLGILFTSINVRSEGSKELYITSHQTGLYCCNDFINKCNDGNGNRSQFAIFNCDEGDRLYFITVDSSETVYMGFSGSGAGTGNHIVFQIKDISGTIVYPESNLPTAASASGFISSIAAARIGPTQIYGAGGYTAIDWHPSTPGTYYIEFNRKTAAGVVSTGGLTIDLFDITIYDTVSLAVKPGRLNSKAWQFTEGQNCSAKTYVYSNDSIITSAEFNNMDGGTWIQFCNQWGCKNTGNFAVDRKSLFHPTTATYLPEFKIFLNPPDSILFPPATTLGHIVPPDPWGERFCSTGHILFHVNVDKPGNAEVQLTFASPYVTKKIAASVVIGENIIDWDGLDGAGVPVPNNVNVTFTVSYINGLTNMPFFDVEGNSNGFIIGIVAPAGSTPLVYWDDTNISGGSTNLTGCLSPPGCHTWTGQWGNLNTVNTWWYNVSASTLPVDIPQWRKPQTLNFIQQPPQSYCAGTNGVTFSVTPEPNTEEYHWSYTGTGVTITHIYPENAFITVDFAANATSGNLEVYGTNYNCATFQGPTSSLAITVKPVPVVNPPLAKSICSTTSANITLNSTPAGSLFSWVSPPPSCTPNIPLCPAGAANATQINDILTVSDLNSGTVTYHISGTLNGCTGPTADYVVSVNPLPDVLINSSTPAVCNGQSTVIHLSSTVPNALFTWTANGSSANVTGFLNGSGDFINQPLFNTGSGSETVTYYIMPNVNGCSPLTPTSYTVTVYPVPVLANSPALKAICRGQPTNITLTSNVTGTQFTWTCTPSSGNVTGYSDNLIPTTILNQVLYNNGFVAETVTYHLTPQANGCDGTLADFVVTVNPKPYLTVDPFSKTICSEAFTNIDLTSSLGATTYSWIAQLFSGNVTGFTNGIGATINQPLTNTLFTPGVVNYIISFTTPFCAGNDTTFSVTVEPQPDLSNSPAAKQICNNTSTNVTLTSNVTGSLFTWTAAPSSAQVTGWNNNITPSVTINDLLVNSGFSIETVTYHITPRANGCDGPVTDYVVTVYPTPDLSNNPKNKSQCDNLSTNITLTSNVSGTLFTWTASPSSAQVTGWNNNITPSVAINDLLVNSGFNIETVTYHLTPHANGCDGVVTDFVVTVYPTPLLTTFPLAQTICTNSPILVNLTSTVAGSSFTWTCTPSSPNLSGYANGNTNQISQTLSNSGFTIETVTYHIIPAANSCSGPMTDYVVTVNPKPDVSNSPLSNQICSGTSPMINLTSNVANANFSWTATPSSAFVTGYSPGSGILINQVLTNTGFNIETVTYHITPTANACTGNTVDFVVTIVSVPDVYFSPVAQTICSASFTNIQVLSHVVGATFTWTALSSSPNITGFFNDVGNLIAQPLLNSGNTIENVTYTVTPAAFGCPVGLPQNVVATVNPKPAITNTVRTQQTCSSQNVSITPLSTVTGSSYSWVASGSSPNVTGFSNGSGLSLTHTLVNSGFNIETVTYVITPTANSCPGDTAHFQVIVFPVADVYFTPATQSICPMQSTNVSINSHAALTTFTWTATGTSLASGYFPDAGSVIQQVLNNTGYNIETVTYHVTPLANGCTGTSNNLIVSVNPNPAVSFVTCFDLITTTTAKPIKLKGGFPLNGIYSGPGVSGGIFYPSIANTGSHTISYGVTNSFGCTVTMTQIINVISPPSFNCGNIVTDIRDNKNYPTVVIGTQCWMAANLDYGNPIPGNLTQRDNCSSEKFCYNDNPGNCSSYGGLYQWDELMLYSSTPSSQGFCPPDWHIPAESEWGILFNYYISNGFAGSALKSTGYSGFNAFLEGTRFKNVSWNFLDFATLFWSSTPRGTTKAEAHGMNYYNPSVSFYPSSRLNAFHIRCIKD